MFLLYEPLYVMVWTLRPFTFFESEDFRLTNFRARINESDDVMLSPNPPKG